MEIDVDGLERLASTSKGGGRLIIGLDGAPPVPGALARLTQTLEPLWLDVFQSAKLSVELGSLDVLLFTVSSISSRL